MPIRFALVFASILTTLTFVSTASAHHWHHGDWDGGRQQQTPDPDWSGPDWSGPSAPISAPVRGPVEAPASNPVWNNNQGDAQETPQDWSRSQPVKWPSTKKRGNNNPWSNIPAMPVSKTPTVKGKTAMIRRNGKAAVPTGAPAKVRAIISAANTIIGKPYKWGGGHGRLFDSGYDCSGSVSYALIRSGLLGYPMVSGSLAHWGAKGVGKYVTIYANKSHVYMEVAGLRLDTSSVGDPRGKSGVRWRPAIGKRFGFAVRHVGGL
jgi:cell wall-associated NlpC family hydrolase